MNLYEIYYIVFVIISYIGCLVFVELETDGQWFIDENDYDLTLPILSHALIVTVSLILPLIWPFIAIYFMIRFIVKSIAKLIRMQRKEKHKGD